MPRDGANIYHRPPGTDAVPDTTIESTKYNTNVADVEQDLNTPRPVVAGGTGASNPSDAQMNLRGDLAYQVVTNFDSQLWVSGSFYCAANTTGAPNTHAFVGICYSSDPPVVPPALPANQNCVIEARDQNDTTVPGRLYVREKKAGVWGAWTVQAGSVADLDAAYVNVAGDTLTGPLVLAADPAAPLQSATKQYVDAGDAAAIAAINARAVRYDAVQALTAAQQLQARQNIYAAPFDAMAYNGLQVNGNCDVSQFNGANPIVVTNGIYAIDGWVVNGTAAGFTAAQVGVGTPSPGIYSALQVTTPSAWAPAAADYIFVRNMIEGYRWARLGWASALGQPVTIGFYIYSQYVTGPATLSVKNGAFDRAYFTQFNINATGTWEYKSITIPPDTLGSSTWNTNNSVGGQINFGLASGSGAGITAAPPNTWSSSASGIALAPTNFFQSGSGGRILITGLTVTPGSQGPSAAQVGSIVRPFDQELLLCQRYWEKSYDYSALPGVVTPNGQSAIDYRLSAAWTAGSWNAFYKVPKRAQPTITVYSPATGVPGKFRDDNAAADVNGAGQWIGNNLMTLSASPSLGTGFLILKAHWAADARL